MRFLAVFLLLIGIAVPSTWAKDVTYATHPSFDAPELSKTEEEYELRMFFERPIEQACGINLIRVPWGQQKVEIYSAVLSRPDGLVDLGRQDASTYSIWIHNGTRSGKTDYYKKSPGTMGIAIGHEFGHFLPEFRPSSQGGKFDYYGHINNNACLMDIDCAARSLCPQEATIFRKYYGNPVSRPDPAGTLVSHKLKLYNQFPTGKYIAFVGMFKAGQWGAGLYDPVSSTFYGRYSLGGGPWEFTVQYGPPNAGYQPIVGDWDGNGAWTVGLYNPKTSTFLLKNSMTPGPADTVFQLGNPSSQPLNAVPGVYSK